MALAPIVAHNMNCGASPMKLWLKLTFWVQILDVAFYPDTSCVRRRCARLYVRYQTWLYQSGSGTASTCTNRSGTTMFCQHLSIFRIMQSTQQKSLVHLTWTTTKQLGFYQILVVGSQIQGFSNSASSPWPCTWLVLVNNNVWCFALITEYINSNMAAKTPFGPQFSETMV